MNRIPFTIRIEGRYSFRRRIHFRNIISKPLTLALQTADPGAARERVAILAARFVIVRADVKTMLEGQRNLTGVEIEAIFRRELEQQLGSWLSDAYADAPWSSSVIEEAARHGEAYRQLRLPDPRHDMDPFERAKLDAPNRETAKKDVTPEWARPLVDQIRNALSDDYVASALKAIGAKPSEANIAAARTHLIRAGASACARAQRVFDDDVLDAADPLRAMTADLGELPPAVAAMLASAEGVTTPVAQTNLPSPAPNTECPFAIYDSRRFSEIIEDTLATLKRKKVWKPASPGAGQGHRLFVGNFSRGDRRSLPLLIPASAQRSGEEAADDRQLACDNVLSVCLAFQADVLLASSLLSFVNGGLGTCQQFLLMLVLLASHRMRLLLFLQQGLSCAQFLILRPVRALLRGNRTGLRLQLDLAPVEFNFSIVLRFLSRLDSLFTISQCLLLREEFKLIAVKVLERLVELLVLLANLLIVVIQDISLLALFFRLARQIALHLRQQLFVLLQGLMLNAQTDGVTAPGQAEMSDVTMISSLKFCESFGASPEDLIMRQSPDFRLVRLLLFPSPDRLRLSRLGATRAFLRVVQRKHHELNVRCALVVVRHEGDQTWSSQILGEAPLRLHPFALLFLRRCFPPFR